MLNVCEAGAGTSRVRYREGATASDAGRWAAGSGEAALGECIGEGGADGVDFGFVAGREDVARAAGESEAQSIGGSAGAEEPH
jgi:hypothetical protein